MNIIQGLAKNLSRNHPNQTGISIDFSKMSIEDAVQLMMMLLSTDATKDMKDLLQEMGSRRITRMIEMGALKDLAGNPAFAQAISDIYASIAINNQALLQENEIALADKEEADRLLATAQKAEGNANDLEHPVDKNQKKKNGLTVPLAISGFVILLIIGGVIAKLAFIPLNVTPTINHGADIFITLTSSAIPPALAIPLEQIATNSPTATIADTDTPSPAATDTSTPTPPPPQVVPTVNAYCRKGPGTLYDQVLVIIKGTPYNVIGRDELSSWWQVQIPVGIDCWVGNLNVTKQGSLQLARIIQGLPLPVTSASFVNTFICDLKLKTFGVNLTWAAAPGATGFRIFRNGELLNPVAGNLTTYHDSPPLGVDLVYDLEAFNANGVAARISTNVPACK